MMHRHGNINSPYLPQTMTAATGAGPVPSRPYPIHAQQNTMMMMPRNVIPFHYPQFVNPADLYIPNYKDRVQIRRVWNLNFEQEMENIRYLINNTPFNVVSIDTEFPGVLFESNNVSDHRNSEIQYSLMKRNVDMLNLIQLGMTISDSEGNLPLMCNDDRRVVWEFAISDFDINLHPHKAESIQMLISHGIDFNFHRNHGINSHVLALYMFRIGLLSGNTKVNWVTFHGSYDFGYLIKAITRTTLPERLTDFKILVEHFFGKNVYDVKCMMEVLRPKLLGGLNTIATKLGIDRIIGVCHQAGSDSLLTQMVFQKIKRNHFKDGERIKSIAGNIYPLD